MHKEATQKLAEKARGVGIDAQLNVELRDDQKHNRSMFMKLLHAIRLLSRQGLPFRSHKEDIVSFSNYISYYYFRLTKDCPEMIYWLNRKAPEIVNEIISAMGQCVLCNNLADIFTAIWYSIIADEATDVSHNEQMSLSVRWVDHSYDIHESTIGFILPNTKAKTTFLAIKLKHHH